MGVPRDLCVGQLTQPIRVERPERPADGAGGFQNEVWNTTYPDALAKREHVSGNEFWRHMRLESHVTDVFWLIYGYDIAVTDRIIDLYTERVYNLRKVVDPDGSRMWLLIQAEAGVVD